MNLLFISQGLDVHVELPAARLRDSGRADVFVVTEKSLAELDISLTESGNAGREWDKVWYRRRPDFEKTLPSDVNTDEAEFAKRQLDAYFASFIYSLARSSFVDHPLVIKSASDKPRQLSRAREVGLNVPPTLVTSSTKDARGFCDDQNMKVVVKPLRPGTTFPISTRKIDADHFLAESGDCPALPAIYQREVEGTRHLRMNIFGEHSSIFEIRSEDTDWRFNLLEARIERVGEDTELIKMCRNLLRQLGLSMGVFDFKIDTRDEIWFFEINPQGQFLFLEPYNNGRAVIDDFERFILG